MDPNHPKHQDYLMKFMDKIFSSLKASELSIEMDTEKGFIFMPAQKPSKKVDKELN